MGKYGVKQSDQNTLVLAFDFKQMMFLAKILKRKKGTGSYQVTLFKEFDRQVKINEIGKVWDQNKPVNVLYKEWKRKVHEIIAKYFKKSQVQQNKEASCTSEGM